MAIDSPSGYSKKVIHYCQKEAEKLGFQTKKTHKGNLEIYVEGQDDYTIGFCGHVDTLGLMVRSIKSDGTLAFTNVGGPIIPTLMVNIVVFIQEMVNVIQEQFFSNYPVVHVYKDAKSAPRDCENMHVRIDEVVKNKEDVKL